MTKKTRKSTVEVNGNTIEAPQYKFKAEYAAWRRKVDSISLRKLPAQEVNLQMQIEQNTLQHYTGN